ncbi:hypothetical protein BLNAU_13668 [Blattamonas nauphoetae]|uniref:RING-type domain-containing protein n=1 Tax=Blattamonas nauphoetae TaxID=2049346 RepID=A0ABQ9XFZ3_9EUKA|nr:hypothetical protein BLNAU_13668 [Blattamonas nauphoetae]
MDPEIMDDSVQIQVPDTHSTIFFPGEITPSQYKELFRDEIIPRHFDTNRPTKQFPTLRPRKQPTKTNRKMEDDSSNPMEEFPISVKVAEQKPRATNQKPQKSSSPRPDDPKIENSGNPTEIIAYAGYLPSQSMETYHTNYPLPIERNGFIYVPIQPTNFELNLNHFPHDDITDGVEGDDSQSPYASSRTSPRQHRRRLPQQPGDDTEKTPSTQMGMSGRPRPRHMYYWQHPSMRDQNYNADEFYPIIVESLTHQYPPRLQQPTYNQQVLVSEDGQADAPSQEFPMTIRSLMHSQQEQAEDTRLPPLYSGDVMSYPLHPHVKALENRNKQEQPPAKVNDVQNPLVDSGRVVVAFPDQQKDFSPFLSQNEHSTVRLQAQRYAKQRADSLTNREGFVNQQQQHINPQFPQQSSAAVVTQSSQSYHRPPQQSENQLFNEEYATSRTNQQAERDFSGSFVTPPTYTNQEQAETTHQSKPISQHRYTQEDIPHFTQPAFYKPQSSTSRLSSRPSRQPASPRTTPEKSRDSSRMSSNSLQVTLKPHIVWFPHYETDPRILMEQTGSQDAIHNSRFYSSIPAYPMNVAPTQIQSESPTRGKKDQTARRLAKELRRTEKERKSERRRRTTREKNEDTAEDTREDEPQHHTRRDKVMGETNNQIDSQDDAGKVNSVNLNNAVSSQPSRDTNRNETEFEADTQTDKDSASGSESEWRRENEDEPTSEEDQTRIEAEETARECWEERLSPPALQLTADKHGLVLSNTIIADSMRDEQVDDFSRLEDSFVARPKPNSSLQERRGERKESPADLTRHTQPTMSSEADAHVITRQFTGAPTTSEEQRLSPNGLDTDAGLQIGMDKEKDGSVDSSLKQEREHLVDPSAPSASNADLLRMIDSLKAMLAETERQRSADKAKFEKELRTMGSVSAEEQSELARLKEENARLTEKMSDFQVRAASLAADKSTLEKSLEQTRQKMEMVRENNTRLEERLEETKREVDEWIGMNEEKSHSIETLHTNIDQLTTERDTLQANLTATNQSLDESNQRIDTLTSEVSSLLSQKAELERLLSKDWLITTDTQTDWVGVSESAAQLASIEKFPSTIVPSRPSHYFDDFGDEIGSHVMLFTESDTRKVREFTEALEKGEEVNKTRLQRNKNDQQTSQTTIQSLKIPSPAPTAETKMGKKPSLAPLSPAKPIPNMSPRSPRKQRSKRNLQPLTEQDVEKQQKEMERREEERRVVEQARKFNEYISSQVGTVASLTAANEMTDGQKSMFDWTWMDQRMLRNRFKAKEYYIEDVDLVVLSFPVFFSFCQQIETETRQLWETVETIRTKFDDVVEILCKAGRQTSHHMGEVKSLVDELDTVNGAMTVDLSCANCLQLMNDPVTFIPCGHTLCRVCAYKYGKQGKTQCPTCSDAANTTRGYVRNFIVESLCTREAVKRQRMDEIRSSSGSLMVTQALLEERMRKLPQARMIMDSYDEEVTNGQTKVLDLKSDDNDNLEPQPLKEETT